jgi:hypothetical protein
MEKKNDLYTHACFRGKKKSDYILSIDYFYHMVRIYSIC